MAKQEKTGSKMDPNTEVYQSRAQAKKIENCRTQWIRRWNWLLDERERTNKEINELRKITFKDLESHTPKEEMQKKTLKPVPLTTQGLVGWLSSKPDCQLEIYTNWRVKIPTRIPDAWENRHYIESKYQ